MPGAQVVAIALAYGVGCVNAAYYLLRWRDGRDIRSLGSGNAGARNAGRILGRGGFALVFVLDAAKGAGAVLVAQAWAPEVASLCAVAVTLGHVFPAQLDWRGGKGVATAIGALAMLDILVLLIVVAAFCAARLARCATVQAGVLAFALGAVAALASRSVEIGSATAALAVLLAYTQRGNLRRHCGVAPVDASKSDRS
jgi:acyl phosphate:glycerol-3-phosphate acyltransferase